MKDWVNNAFRSNKEQGMSKDVSINKVRCQPLSLTSHINCIAAQPDKHCLSHGMCLYQVMMMLHFFNDVANDAESTQTTIIAS